MALIEIIKKDKNARRLFGSKELEIVEKQLLGVQLSMSEKTRLSRDIRKKFKIIKEMAQFSDQFDLKKGADIKFKINEALEVIKESKYFSKVKKIILFGSFVDNTLRLNSDIDIAVEFKDITPKEATKFRVEISGKTNDKIDIQVYNILPKKLKKEINEKGKIIYEKNKR